MANNFTDRFNAEATAEVNLARATWEKVGNIQAATNICVIAWSWAAYRNNNPSPALNDPDNSFHVAAQVRFQVIGQMTVLKGPKRPPTTIPRFRRGQPRTATLWGGLARADPNNA